MPLISMVERKRNLFMAASESFTRRREEREVEIRELADRSIYVELRKSGNWIGGLVLSLIS